jgi:transcriptional regulator with XRE-family HTH domain
MVLRESAKTEIDLFVVNRVRQLRTEQGMTQAVLAVKLGVSNAFIGAIENPKNRAKFNLSHINKLAQIFGCSPRFFLPEKSL